MVLGVLLVMMGPFIFPTILLRETLSASNSHFPWKLVGVLYLICVFIIYYCNEKRD